MKDIKVHKDLLELINKNRLDEFSDLMDFVLNDGSEEKLEAIYSNPEFFVAYLESCKRRNQEQL